MYKFLKTTTKWVGYLPFSGRLTIKPTLISVYGNRGLRKYRNLIGAWLLLAFFVVGHGFQAWMGYFLYSNVDSVFLKAIGVLYGVTNVLVTYAQTFLFFRVTAHCIKP